MNPEKQCLQAVKNPAFSCRLVTAINQIINVLNAANASQFDRRLFQSIKVDSIEDKSQFSQSVLNLLFIKSVKKYVAWEWIKERKIYISY